MTAQIPDRILVDGKPHWLHARPLDRLLDGRETAITAPDGRTTACHRQYVGTWRIADGRLWLVALNTFGCAELPLTDTMRAGFLGLAATDRFPISAKWLMVVFAFPRVRCSCGGFTAGRRGSRKNASSPASEVE